MSRGIVVAGLRGGGGKSVAAVGLVAALAREKRTVAAFKKGPDYIDAGWLGLAAGRPCRNLDLHLMGEKEVQALFLRHAAMCACAVVEGNRGLFDGFDARGSSSTAELACSLSLPVVLVVDCTKVTRTVAAMVLGCARLDRRMVLCGVILNRVATSRQEKIIRRAVEHDAGIPVLGALPRHRGDFFPQRHLGVVPFQEHDDAAKAVAALGGFFASHADLHRIQELMASVVPPPVADLSHPTPPVRKPGVKIPVGVLRDAAFQFYYPDNLEALEAEGADLVPIDALHQDRLPDIAGLYIGGGFPETSVARLAENEGFRASLREAAVSGLPIYAECGGLIYLGRSLRLDGVSYPLTNVFPVDFSLAAKPQAHGYTAFTVDRQNPFFPQGFSSRGHEFRYSKIDAWDGCDLAISMDRGTGFDSGRDGLVRGNTLAMYTHLHAVATPMWAVYFMQKVRSCL